MIDLIKRIIAIKFALLFLILGFTFVSFSEVNIDTSKFEEILFAADLGDELINSGKGTISWERKVVDNTGLWVKVLEEYGGKGGDPIIFEKSEISYFFEGIKISSNSHLLTKTLSGGTIEGQYLTTYNGENCYRLRYEADPKGLLRATGSTGELGGGTIYKYDPRVIGGLTINGASVGSFLRGSLNYNFIKIKDRNIDNLNFIGDNVFNNMPCKVFQGYLPDTMDTLTVWLSPSFLYRPIFIEKTSQKWKSEIHFNFAKFEGNLFFPKEMISKDYIYDYKSGKYVLTVVEKMNVHSDFVVNIDLPDSLFKIKFPKGIKVYDKTGKSHFVE